MKKTILLGTRGSKLAMIQTREIQTVLRAMFPDVEVNTKVITTEGDHDLHSPLSSFGGRGAFVHSLEQALLNKEIDAAVHSLKDLPSRLPNGLILGAVPSREDPRDTLITRDGSQLMSLQKNSVIGTGSDRRRVQLRQLRPDVQYKNIRGNIETRLDKLGTADYNAVVIAAAAMKRLGMQSLISEYMEPDTFIPAPCQGALGVECRSDDRVMLEMLRKIDSPDVRMCVDVERTFIYTLEMGCHAPIGAFARIGQGGVIFYAFVGYGDGNILKKTVQASNAAIQVAVRNLGTEFKTIIAKQTTMKE